MTADDTGMDAGRSIRINKQAGVHPGLILAGLALIAAAWKLFLFIQRWPYIDPDEGYYLLLARNLVSGAGYGLNGLPNVIFPPVLPAAIGGVFSLTHNLPWSLNILTILSGTALGWLIYELASRLMSRGYALVSAGAVLFSSQMNDFIPAAEPYVRGLYRGSDIVNLFLVFAAILAIVKLAETRTTVFAVLAGLALAAAYLTRPEGVVLFALTLGMAAFLAWRGIIRLGRSRLLVFALVFMSLALPYVLFLKSATGRWMVTGKASPAREYRDALLRVIESDDWADFHRLHYALSPDETEMRDIYFGYYPQANERKNMVEFTVTDAFANLKKAGALTGILFPPPILPFVFGGLILSLVRIFKRRSFPDALILMLPLCSLAVISGAYPIPRHHLVLVPLSLIYAVDGLRCGIQWLSRQKYAPERMLLPVILAFYALFVGYEFLLKSNRNALSFPGVRAYQERTVEIASILKSKAARTVMSNHPQVAVFAGSDWQVMPTVDLEDVVRFGLRKNVDFAVLPLPDRLNFQIIDLQGSPRPDQSEGPILFRTEEVGAFHKIVRIAPGAGSF